MNDFFLDLSKKENGKYHFNNETVSAGNGSRSPYNIHLLNLNYKNQKIQIKNEIGLGNIGSVSCIIPRSNKLSEFSIRTRSHFFKLFRKDKKSFIIKCQDEKLKDFISKNISLSHLQEYTLNTQFELIIHCTIDNNRYEINAEYNIIFENRENVVLALIQFYKDLINKLYS